MPSPIAHAAIGYVIYRLAANSKLNPKPRQAPVDALPREAGAETRQSSVVLDNLRTRLTSLPALLLVSIFFSLLPDADAIPGLLFGELGAFHNQFTHSLVTGALAALAAGSLGALLLGRSWAPAIFLTALLAFELHVAADFFTYHSRGVMLFWPFTSARFVSPVKLFYGVRWSQGLFSPLHWITLATELGFSALLILAAERLVRRRPPHDLPAGQIGDR